MKLVLSMKGEHRLPPMNGSRGNAANHRQNAASWWSDAERFPCFSSLTQFMACAILQTEKFQHGRSGKPFQPGFHLMFGFRTHQGTALLP